VRRPALYSSSSKVKAAPSLRTKAPLETAPVHPEPRASRVRNILQRHRQALGFAAGAVFALSLVAVHASLTPVAAPMSQEDLDKSVARTLQNITLPSVASKAYELIRPSVVRVRRLDTDDTDVGVGTGVVIVEDGTILTNIHVVQGAKKIGIVFADGSLSEADIIAVQPEDDLAVLRAKVVPDDLFPATMRSTLGLKPGDHVVAVGYPFGIGPSATAGVVSGLKREYHSPDGDRKLRNLIQFDAAANPGNSGGPLVTAEGELIGIVTGILNPTGQRVWAGIGFAVPIENAAGAAGLSPF
jgi:S1-C subfamily serine protease